MAIKRLSDLELSEALSRLEKWQKKENAIQREVDFATYRQVFGVVQRLVDLAEGANHHPDLTWSYCRLSIRLSTHDSGGVTLKDIHLAQVIEDVLAG